MGKTIKDYMVEHPDQNLDRCRPYVSKNEKIAVVEWNGKIIELLDDGDKINNPTNEQIYNTTKKLIGEDYETYKGWTDEYILLENLKEIGCVNCPWFDICEAMEDEVIS